MIQVYGDRSLLPASETMGQIWGQWEHGQLAGGGHLPTLTLQDGFCLLGWLIWFR